MKKSISIITIVILVFVVVVLGVGVMWLIHTEGFPVSSAPEEEAKTELYAVPITENFVANPYNSSAFIQCKLSIYVDEAEKEAFIEKESAIIRDTILSILRSKTDEEVRARDIQTTLSDEICARLNEHFGVTFFVRVYFMEYVVL